jgi:hypothetical protein
MNKCLARNNKSRTVGEATKKQNRRAARERDADDHQNRLSVSRDQGKMDLLKGLNGNHLIMVTVACAIALAVMGATSRADVTKLPPQMLGAWCMSDPNSQRLSKRNCYGNPNVADQVILIGNLCDISIAYAIWPHCRNGPCYSTLLLLAYCPGGTP